MSITKKDEIENVSVLIVGGSLVGLSTSLFLSWHGIASLVVERHPGTAIHPRLASMTSRTMELYRSSGSEAAIRAVEPPFPQDNRGLMLESLVGKQLGSALEDMSAYHTTASPVQGSLIAQDVLEPVLRAQAEKQGGDLRYGTELVAFEQDEEGVTATIRELSSGITRTIRADYLIGADGNQSTVRKQLGIGQHGMGVLGQSMSMIFEADLMEMLNQRQALMFIVNNDKVSGYFIPYQGSSARPDLFRLDVMYDPAKESVADYTEERCLSLIRAAIGIEDFPVKLKTVIPWVVGAYVADRFQEGRIFLVGDAARVQPPTGALGGNTGIAEAHNLAWKLAAVIRGEAGVGLLSTYEQERRPIADLTVEQVSLLSQQRMSLQPETITVNPLMVNMGYRYAEGALLPEHEEAQPQIQDPLQWKGEPGTRAPHIVLGRAGEQISTLDLLGREWVLLTGTDGQRWKEAAAGAAKQLNIPLNIYQIGDELVDTSDSFGHAYGISSTGAVLVRPDGFVAWRVQEGGEESRRALEQALSRLL